uniref:Uncharacterized protein n=1 Tax=viral metagenome TaxID=1070528 RepID=A0A6M3IPE1_9ZZZZ
MTKTEAQRKADRLAKQTDRPCFVVVEDGVIDYCSDFDLNTFYQTIPEQNILYCTADGWY